MTPTQIHTALHTHPTITAAARALGVSRSTLYRWLHRMRAGEPLSRGAGGRPRTQSGACSVEGCDRPAAARGMCREHATVAARGGEPGKGRGRPRKTKG